MIDKIKIENIIKSNGIVFINDVAEEHNRESYINLVNILHNIGINNKKIKIKVYCKICNEEIIVSPSIYKKQKKFCCDKHMKHKRSGEDSPFYHRIKVNCTNCEKEYSVIPYDYKKKNRFGDNHNFCCQKCYWEYRSKYYVDKKHPMYGSHQSEENIERQRKLVLDMISNGLLPQTMTKSHITINNLLSENNIDFENEYQAGHHSVDIYLPEYNLMIEIMGDYWHAHPLKYNINNLTKQQKKSIKQDKSKKTYIYCYENINILYLWESDINKSIDLCLELIQYYIKNNGILSNYHSFNYHINNGKLILNDIIATPFQDIYSYNIAI